MIKHFLCAFLVFFATLATAQKQPKEIYPIRIDPIEETSKARHFTMQEETNWGRTLCTPNLVVAKAMTLVKYKVHFHILDTGDPSHVYLQNGKVPGLNMTSETIADGNSHGTHCAGIIAAQGFGLAQSLFDAGFATFQADKVLTNGGFGSFNWIQQVIDASFEADKQKINSGTAVIYSGSLGADVAPIASVEASLKRLWDIGGIPVFSSGNSGTEKVGYPASSPYAIAVSSLDENLQPSSFSSTGPQIWFGAPGRNINSTILNNMIGKKSGTSMACPAQAALMGWAKAIWGPAIPNADYMRRYMGWCAVDIMPAGKDNKTGYGLSLLDNITKKDPKDMPVGWPNNPPPPPLPPADPTRNERTMNYSFTGSWKVLWGLNVAAGIGDDPQFVKRVLKANKTSYETLEFTAIEFTAPSSFYWKKASKDSKAVVDWFFKNRGMIMPSPSDEYDVAVWLPRFFEMMPEIDKRMSGIVVTSITAKDSNGNTIKLSGSQVEHFPRK